MAKTPQITLSVGDESISITDPSVVDYAQQSGDRAVESLRTALLCGVAAMDAAGATKEVLALEARLSGVQNEVSSQIRDSASELLDLLRQASNPSIEGSLAAGFGKSMDAKAQAILSSLDPTNPKSPFALLVAEIRGVTHELVKGSTKADATKEAGEKLAIKGRLFEEDVFLALSSAVSQSSDTVEPTGDETGLGTSKKGDFIIKCHGDRPLSIVVEAKRKKISLTRTFIDKELRAGMNNRGASAAILVVHPEFQSCVGSPFKMLGDNMVAVVFDPEKNDITTLVCAYQITKAAILFNKFRDEGVDVSFVTRRLDAIAARAAEFLMSERAMSISIDDLDKVRSQIGNSRRGLLRDIEDLTREVIGDTHVTIVDERAPIAPIQIDGAGGRKALPETTETEGRDDGKSAEAGGRGDDALDF